MLFEFLGRADLVFAVGSSMTRTPFGPNVPDGKRIVHSTNDADDINKDYRVDHAVIGDARLSLQAAPDDTFDLLILDAFSSDAIPVHLLTAEAFAMYRRRLAPGGVIMAHISNRYLDLEPVLGRVTQETGLFGVIQYHEQGTSQPMLRYPSIWVVMARSPDDIIELAPDRRWEPLRGANAPLWTDDYVNILGALRRGEEGG